MVKLCKGTLLAIFFFTGSAWAEWVQVSKDPTNFVDIETLRKDGTIRKVWTISNLQTPRNDGALSYRSRMEFDCKDERFRILFLSSHSSPMAGGFPIFTNTDLPSGWNEIPPGSGFWATFKFVCAK